MAKMGRASISIEGMDVLQRKLKEAPRKTRALLRDMLEESAEAVAAQARTHVPRIEGDLYRAIQVAGRGLTWRAGLEDLEIGSRRGQPSHTNPAIYGPMVERGGANNTARPFMKPAAEGETTRITGRLRKLANALESALR